MIQNALASVAVKDLPAAVRWYERILGRPADAMPMPDIAEWRFERGGWLQIYQLAERAGSGSFTLVVSDILVEVGRLRALGIDIEQQSADRKVETLIITDPDGNHIAFAHWVTAWTS